MDIKTFKNNLLHEIYSPYAQMKTCPLKTYGCTKFVSGEGNPDAAIMFIGEAPGQDEDTQGRPFVGRSGKLLNKCLHELGLNREDVFITNVVKCRPPNNRKPLPNEIAYFKTLLVKEIKIVRPKIICTLGSSALEALINHSFTMSKIRGSILSFENIDVIPTYHPAYVLRNPAAESDLKHDLIKALKKSHDKN